MIASFALPRHFVPTAGYVDESAKLVFLSQRGSDYYRFSFSGEFFDRRTWFRDFVSSVEGLTLYFVVRDEYGEQKNWTPDEFREAAGYIERALQGEITDSFHLSRSDVFNFLALLHRRANNENAAATAESSAQAALDGFRVVDQMENRLTEIIEQGDASNMREQISRLDKAATYPRLASYRSYFGRLFKLKGALYQALGDRANAIAAFRRALEINPRVGCKKELKQLEKSQ
jgi:tetratricopeptide (TPR) repeat protein